MTSAAVPGRSVTVRVPAKVNLELLVGPRRDDGYHHLSTVFHAVSLYDDVTVGSADEWGVSGHRPVWRPGARGRRPTSPCVRPASWPRRRFDVEPVHISIRKDIPVAGGMAGGSADAAATLVACDAPVGPRPRPRGARGARLPSSAATCPSSSAGGTAMGSGRGEHAGAGAGPRHLPLGLRPQPRAACRPRPCTPSATGCAGDAPVPEPVADRADDDARCAAATRDALGRRSSPTTSRRPRSRCAPTSARCWRPGMEYGALGGVVSGSGPTIAFLVEDNEAGIDLAVALTARGRGARRAPGERPGPRRPRHPRTGSTDRGQPRLRRARLPRARHRPGARRRLARRRRRRPDRRRRPQRWRQDHPAAGAEGRREVDSGRVARVGGLTIGVLDPGRRHGPRGHGRTRRCIGDLPEHVWAGDARIRDVLTGLLGGTDAPAVGWHDGARSARSPAASADGWRWPRCSSPRPDLLLLDEPTNHLDVEGVAWLADHLVRRHARAGQRRRRRSPTTGGSSTRSPPRPGRSTRRVGALLRGRLRGVRAGQGRARADGGRSPPSAATTCCARSSPGCAAARRRAPASPSSGSTPPTPSSPTSRRPATTSSWCGSRRPGSARTSSTWSTPASTLGDRVLLDHVTWRLAPGERTGIVGVNGAGKSTLLRAHGRRRAADRRQAQGRA